MREVAATGRLCVMRLDLQGTQVGGWGDRELMCLKVNRAGPVLVFDVGRWSLVVNRPLHRPLIYSSIIFTIIVTAAAGAALE